MPTPAPRADSWFCRRPILLVLAMIIAGACSRPLDRPEEIAGRYQLRADGERDELVLEPNGRYIRIFTPRGGVSSTDTGTWGVARLGGEPRVVLSDFVPRGRAHSFPGAPARAGDWAAYVERTFSGGVRIRANEDLGLHYVRQD